jgi:hypothetical protein
MVCDFGCAPEKHMPHHSVAPLVTTSGVEDSAAAPQREKQKPINVIIIFGPRHTTFHSA